MPSTSEWNARVLICGVLALTVTALAGIIWLAAVGHTVPDQISNALYTLIGVVGGLATSKAIQTPPADPPAPPPPA